MIKKGDTVRFKPEWRDDGDDAIVFIAVEDEADGRVTVEAQLDLRFKPLQTVKVSMIEGN